MKKFVVLLTLLGFAVAAPLAMAREKAKKQTPEKITCCHEGKCKSTTEYSCNMLDGKVFESTYDCEKECKPEPDAGKAKKEKPKKITCCVKGKCKSMTEDKCKSAMGDVFESAYDCKKECKPPKTKPKKRK